MSDAVVHGQLLGHPMVIDGLDSRRAVWDRLSLFDRATATARLAADTACRHLGDHPRSAALLARLCDSIVKRGSLNDAIDAVIGTVRMRRSVLGDHHQDTASSYRTLAYLMLRTGQYDQAERFGLAAIESASAISAVVSCRKRSASEVVDVNDNDDGYEGGGSSSAHGATDDDGVSLLNRIVVEAKEIIGQAHYRKQCKSSVFVQLETRIE